MAGVIRKRTSSEANGANLGSPNKKHKSESSPSKNSGTSMIKQGPSEVAKSSALECIAILPGLGSYKDTSDSDDSSDIESPIKYDLVGKRIEDKLKDEC